MTDEAGRETAKEVGADATAPLGESARACLERDVLPHLDAAYNLARHLLRDPDDAEDAVQEAALRAARSIGGWRGVSGRAWLLAIVRNTCISLMRSRRTRGDAVPFEEETFEMDAAALRPAPSDGPEAEFFRSVAAERLRHELDRLPAAFREALVLRELEGLSYKEIAQVAGVPVGTVMSRLSRGRRLLSEALAGREFS